MGPHYKIQKDLFYFMVIFLINISAIIILYFYIVFFIAKQILGLAQSRERNTHNNKKQDIKVDRKEIKVKLNYLLCNNQNSLRESYIWIDNPCSIQSRYQTWLGKVIWHHARVSWSVDTSTSLPVNIAKINQPNST